MRARLFGAMAVVCTAWAQTPAFEVASMKVSEPITPELVRSGRLQMGVTIDSHYVRIGKLSLMELVGLAYQVKPHQLSGQPWMNMERYDIQAKLPEGGARRDVPAMLQTLLAQRLGLRVRREAREMRVYALVTAKGGPRLQESAEPPAPSPPTGQIRGGLSVNSSGQLSSVAPGGNSQVTPGPNGNLHVESKQITMARFADFINRYCELPVVDMTGLSGYYDLEIDVSSEEARNAGRARGAVVPSPAEGASDPSGALLPVSLQKLGLRLEARKAPVEVIVVEHAEKVPTEN
jgi:uncharacterized protein (TIGR03435 family)